MLTGKELKIRRIMLDIKAKQVSEHLDIHNSYVSKMESEVQRIPEQIYEKWVEFLGVDDESILGN